MGKKSRKYKLAKEADPIFKKVFKKKVKPIQESEDIVDDNATNEGQQNNQDYDSQGEEYEEQDQGINKHRLQSHIINLKKTSNANAQFNKFMKYFHLKQNQSMETEQQDGLMKQISAKQQTKLNKQSQFRKVPSYQQVQRESKLPNHFDYAYESIQQTLCMNQEQQEQQSNNLLSTFFKSAKQAITSSLTHQLNNGVEFKDYNILEQYKQKSLIDCGCDLEDYHIEELSKQYLLDNKQFISTAIDNKKSLNQQLIEQYYDYIHTDPEESNSAQFRDIYTSHIYQHLTRITETNGFTRCSILILTPFKGDAIDIINRIIGHSNVVFNRERYENEFCDEDRLQEDDFRIGISLSKKKKQFKLHTNFDKSDIIVASPLGLKLIIGTEGDQRRECHFLSSIEILTIDRASTILMQNWDHLESVLKVVNKLPEHKHITMDLETIRPYFFENMSKFYRQNIIYTNHYFSELNYIRSTYFNNYQGCISNKVYYQPLLASTDQYEQEYRNVPATSQEVCIEKRLNLFKTLWNDVENVQGIHYDKTIVFVQSYFDFVKLKNHFKRINSQVECVSEYTKRSKVQSVISKFNSNIIKYIMMTERAFYFEVCQIRKMKHIIFYQLPQHAFIYKSLVSDIDQLNDKTRILTFFSKYDAFQLEQLVGTQKAEEMLSKENVGSTFII